ncbi:alpha/beta hydrolase [Nocardia otitidiscaviarum]|uniref:alpha/beta fold hydrolase n=1 Tax=Nocardia otitidiscaviarum TaxID=1823 RepID=UPI001893679B|nr:alpha/beta hydrolase [Nocardia otitidiscaviarum]MBF6136954.1 alpha/beta hydrolase [Nocardia otitidiscaviarum]
MEESTAPIDHGDPDSRFVTVDGLRVHYRRNGTGPSILLLHGSGSSLESWDRVAAMLSESGDVIRPDLPGFGRTGPRQDRDYAVGKYAETLAKFLDALGIASVTVVGNSLGGNIGWNFALDFPQRVDRLVLINSTGYPDKSLPLAFRLARSRVGRVILRRLISRSAIERNLRTLVGANQEIVDDAMVDRVYGMMRRPGNQQAFIDFANIDQVDRTAELSKIGAPTLVLRSASIDGQHFARDIRGSRELLHPDGGHLLPEEDPQWVADAVRRFISNTQEPQ